MKGREFSLPFLIANYCQNPPKQVPEKEPAGQQTPGEMY